MFVLNNGTVTVTFDPVGHASVVVTYEDKWGVSGEQMPEDEARARWRALRRKGYRRIV